MDKALYIFKGTVFMILKGCFHTELCPIQETICLSTGFKNNQGHIYFQ